MTGELQNDDRVPYNLENNAYECESKCKRFKEGQCEFYEESEQ